MKFKLVEDLDDGILYHCSDTTFESFRDNEQGSHFCFTPIGAKDVAEDKLSNAEHVYLLTCQYQGKLKPLKINIDTQYWGAEAIAEMLLAKKYGNTNVWASDSKSQRNKRGQLLARNIPSDEIDMDPKFINSISENDIKLLKYFEEIRNSEEFDNLTAEDAEGLLVKNFKDLAEWLEKKGFNCLIYPLAESKTGNDAGVLIFNNSKVRILNIEQIR